MKSILLVEDSQTQATYYRNLLVEAGYSVRHVPDGQAALRACSEARPSLIVVDKHLGRLSGLEVCRRIKDDPTSRLIPVLILTSGEMKREELAALEAGADRFLMKDNPPETLLAVISHLLETSECVAVEESSELLTRALFVDDDPTFLFRMQNELVESGFQVTCAPSGSEALPLLEKNDFDVCIIDIIMPVMDGYELCRRTRSWAVHGQKQLGLLMLTAKEDKDALLKSLDAGADDFVNKTTDLEVIIARVRALARRMSMLRQTENMRRQMLLKDVALREAEWKRQEAELRAQYAKDLEFTNTQLESVNRELEAFSYSVAHDLRAPLRTIDGFAQMILEDHASNLDKEGIRKLTMVAEGARRMGILIDDLLEFSRIGRAVMNPSDVDMSDLVQEVLRELLAACPERRIELQVGALVPAWGDRTLLRQVFVNLLGNAIKYSGRRELAKIEIGCTSSAKENTYWVKDNGAGFDMKYSGKLFGVFQRLHTNKEFEGTGVGLALVQRLLHRHGGKIQAESAVDQGATFTFTLPTPGGENERA